MEQYASFVCLKVRDENVFGTARMDMRIPCAGTLDDIPFGVSALADFCEGLAFKALAENVQLMLEGAGYVLVPEADVRSEIRELTFEGFAMWRGGGIQGHGLEAEMSALTPTP